MKRYVQFRARAAAVGIAVLAVVVLVSTAAAGPAGAVKTFTGCLVTGDGVIVRVKEGDSPKSACSSGQTLARLSGGDITKISVTGALTLPDGPGTGESGDVTIGLKPEFTLPSGCDDGEIAEWDTAPTPDRWICGVDNDTTYAASTGLDLSAGNAFSIEPGYRVPGKTCTTAGEFSRGFDSTGAIQCSAPSTGGVQAYSAHVGQTTLAGDTLVISKTLPAGTYLLFATVSLINQDGDGAHDGESAAGCSIPGYTTGTHELFFEDVFSDPKDTLALSSAINHAGGAVELRCTEEEDDVDVFTATLTAIKVDTLG